MMGRWCDNFRALELTDDELLVLDGRCRPEVQKYVDRVKSYNEKAAAGMPEYLAEILAEAERVKVLMAERSSGAACARCGASGWTDPVYVRGPKKGQRNPRKHRVYHSEIKVVHRHFCLSCWENHVFEEIYAAVEPLYEVKIKGIETKALLDVELLCSECKKSFWKTDVDQRSSWRCPTIGCNGHLQQPRKSEVRLIEVEALNAARRMMQA